MTKRPTPLALLCLITLVAPSLGHEETRQAARRERIKALADARAAADDTRPTSRDNGICRLQIELVDQDPQRPVPGLVRLVNPENNKPIQISDEIHRAANWYSLDASAVVRVPQMQLRVEAVRGLETKLASQVVDLRHEADGKVRLQMSRFDDRRSRGLRSGNTHLHLMNLTHAEAIRYLRIVPRSDDLDLVFLSHLRRIPDEKRYISNLIVEDSFQGGSLHRLSQHGVLFANGEEHRHNFDRGGEGYGHVMLLDLKRLIRPVSIGPGIMREGNDGRSLQRGITQARDDGATVIWCHNSYGFEDIPNWVAGLIDAQNIFDGSIRDSYDASYYRYLDLGLKVPFSTGTDWFIYDFARVYVPLVNSGAGDAAPETAPLTSASWLKGLRQGRSFITNGPMLELAVDRNKPGDTIRLSGSSRVTIVGRGTGRRDFGGLELIYNGHVVHQVQAVAQDGFYAARLEQSLEVDRPGWIALRIPADVGQTELDRPLFAHTSPIYVEIGGKRIFRAEVASEMIDEIGASMKTINEEGVFASDEDRHAVMEVYRRGIQELQRCLEQSIGPYDR